MKDEEMKALLAKAVERIDAGPKTMTDWRVIRDTLGKAYGGARNRMILARREAPKALADAPDPVMPPDAAPTSKGLDLGKLRFAISAVERSRAGVSASGRDRSTTADFAVDTLRKRGWPEGEALAHVRKLLEPDEMKPEQR